jgi:hypothetical protein
VGRQYGLAGLGEFGTILLQAGQDAKLVRDQLFAVAVRVAVASVFILLGVRPDVVLRQCDWWDQESNGESDAADHDVFLLRE